jgi:anti-anti-sigma factor
MTPPFGTVEVEHHHDDLWIVALVGEHDLSTAGVIEQRLVEVHSHGTRVVVDLSDTTFMDSTVLRVILKERDHTASAPDSPFAVVAPSGSPARRLLELVQIPGVALAESRVDALALVSR